MSGRLVVNGIARLIYIYIYIYIYPSVTQTMLNKLTFKRFDSKQGTKGEMVEKSIGSLHGLTLHNLEKTEQKIIIEQHFVIFFVG